MKYHIFTTRSWRSSSMTIFFAWAAVFWFWWPIKLLEIDTNIDSSKKPDGATTERTRLV